MFLCKTKHYELDQFVEKLEGGKQDEKKIQKNPNAGGANSQ